jgi:hypothetical protein
MKLQSRLSLIHPRSNLWHSPMPCHPQDSAPPIGNSSSVVVFLSSTYLRTSDVSPSASSYFAGRAPRSPLSSPLSNLFDLPLEPINYPPLSPKRRNDQSLQRKSTILGLLKKTQSAISLRSTIDAAAPEGPAMATLAPVEVKRALSLRVDKGFSTSKREKKVPPPIVIVPYQE